jgi:hypothetical protein
VVYGNPETTTGGNALKFYASVRLDIRKTGTVKNGEQVVGNKTRVKVVKNKVAPPFRECEFEITYRTGISAVGEIVDLASEAGLIEKSGAYYSMGGERIAQGRDKACQYLGEHPELVAELRDKLVALRKAENARLGAPVPAASGRVGAVVAWNDVGADRVESPFPHTSREVPVPPSLVQTVAPPRRRLRTTTW